jgi:ABC-type polysaccharide/polyol phosphate export permease
VFGSVSLLDLYKLNPMADFVEVYHALLFRMDWPNWGELAYACTFSLAMLAFGLYVFKRLEPRLAEEL